MNTRPTRSAAGRAPTDTPDRLAPTDPPYRVEESEEAIDPRTVRSALELATRAPSVHNSQPWRWRVGRRTVHLHPDLRRWLPVTDTEGRDIGLSCGAALHHLIVALGALGLTTRVHRLPNPTEPDHFAAVELRAGPPADTDLADADLADAIVHRRTDRRRYTDWEVPDAFVTELVARAADHGALLRPVTDPAARRRLVRAIEEAGRTQEATEGYRTETTLWSGASTGTDGVPAGNLLADPVGTGDGTARRFAPGQLDQPADGTDGALLLVLGTTSDDPLSWLRAGEAMSAVLLHTTRLGLAGCPLSQPLEVPGTRIAVRDEILGGTLVPQLVLRIGWAPSGPPLPATPRRPVEEVMDTTAD